MKLLLPILSLIIYVLSLSSCGCKNDTEYCPGISYDHAQLIRYQTNDTIRFTNGQGNIVDFIVNTVEKSQGESLDCTNTGYGCNCDECETFANYGSSTQDSIWGYVETNGNYSNWNRLLYQVNEITTTTAKLNFQVSNLFYSISYPFQGLADDQTVLQTITLGSSTYEGVVLCNIDTTQANHPNSFSNHYFMSKVYFHPEYGVIAFHDLKSNTLYYLE